MERPEIVQKAWKLIEALAEPCEQPNGDDHGWSTCRRCLAAEEVDTKEARMLFRVLLGEMVRHEASAPGLASTRRRVR